MKERVWLIFEGRLEGHGDLLLQAFETGGRCWIGLTGDVTEITERRHSVVTYWSSTAGDINATPVDELIEALTRRLAGISDIVSFNEQAMYWPRGWAYWGGGIPTSIQSLLGEYGRLHPSLKDEGILLQR